MVKSYIGGLLEIRGILALIVLFSHIDQLHNLLNIRGIGLYETNIAGFAVTAFFSLSGFIITFLLMNEKKQKGYISLKHFFIRRTLRLLPPYYLTVVVSIFLMIIGVFKFPETSDFIIGVVGYLIFVPNVLYPLSLAFAGTSLLWSIGVEAQFYFLWSLLIRYTNNFKETFLCFIILFIVVKTMIFVVHPTGGLYALINLTRFDCMAIGALAAYYVVNENGKMNRLFFHPFIQLISTFSLVLPFFLEIELFANLENEVFSLLSSIWFFNIAKNERFLFSINSKILRFIGSLSYGVYVYHFIIIYIIARLNISSSFLLTYFIVLLSVLGVSHLSFNYIERPLLKVKKNFSSQ